MDISKINKIYTYGQCDPMAEYKKYKKYAEYVENREYKKYLE